MNRRRALRLIGAAACVAGVPAPLWARELSRVRWRGALLGTLGEITLYHEDPGTARALLESCVVEIERLEQMVSLYRADSLINRLNREARLTSPPPELVGLLREAQAIGDLTDGAFDITVQPLWRLYAEHFASPEADPNGPSVRAIEAARGLVDYRGLDVATKRLRLARPGMALTLNGIAQGWLTDRIADRLRDGGIAHLLVDLGELRAAGGRGDGSSWRVALDGGGETVDLLDGGIATSSASGTVFERTGRFNHLFDPHSGRSAGREVRLTVRADSAMHADAFATALAVMPLAARPAVLEGAGARRLQLVETSAPPAGA